MRKQAHPLITFEGLTQAQVNQIDHWLKEHPVRKVVEIIREKFQRYISKSTLQRFATWRCAKEALGASPEAVAAAQEINQFAATAKTTFSAATIHLLEQQAFQLALTRQDDEDLKALKDILFLIHRHDSNEIWKRRVRVQEERFALEKPQNKTDPKHGALLVSQAVNDILNGFSVKGSAGLLSASEGVPPEASHPSPPHADQSPA